MSSGYKIGNLCFYPDKNEIRIQDKLLSIRPKTSDLLNELVKANGKIVSKTELLERVWSDVVVEEYVIFQSITELRKILDDPKLIKTHPRKGYSISATISQIDDVVENPVNEETRLVEREYVRPRIALFSLFILTIILSLYYYYNDLGTKNAGQGSIIVLPVNNLIEDSGYRWIHYGGMDLVIQQLQPQLDSLVLPTEQVLEVLKRESLNSGNIDESAIERLFEVTGAQLIVAQSLSGYSRDYQLVYSIHNGQEISRGALTGEDTSELFLDLSTLLRESLGAAESNQKKTYQNDFANEMMASAIEHMQSERYQQAVTMFEAVIVTEPDNLSAARMLVKSMVYQGDYAAAESAAANSAMLANEKGDAKNLGRLLFWQGLSLTQQGQFVKALRVLEQAKTQSLKTNDLLYLANGSRVVGKIHLSQDSFDKARLSISEALSFYQAIQEPYGQATMHIDLGELELAQQKWDEAQASFEQSLAIAEKSRLQQLIDNSNAWLEKVREIESKGLSGGK